jgi:hypothetical protein
MNECDYVLTGETTGEDEGTDATVWIECANEGEQIEIDVTGLLTLGVPPQTPTSGGVTYTNNAGGTVTINATATGITYNCEPHFICTLGGIATEGNDADYTGAVVAHGAAGGISVSEE